MDPYSERSIDNILILKSVIRLKPIKYRCLHITRCDNVLQAVENIHVRTVRNSYLDTALLQVCE